MEIITEHELYQRILKTIEEKREQEMLKPEKERTHFQLPGYLLLKELGLSSQVYYDIERYVNGKNLNHTKSRPLHKRKLNELCGFLEIKLMKTYYGVGHL